MEPRRTEPLSMGRRLQALIDSGTVWIDGGNYVGKASDGVDVDIGEVCYEDTVEMYLAEHPTPNTW